MSSNLFHFFENKFIASREVWGYYTHTTKKQILKNMGISTIELENGSVFEGETLSEALKSYINFFTENDDPREIREICEEDDNGGFTKISQENLERLQEKLDDLLLKNRMEVLEAKQEKRLLQEDYYSNLI